MSYKTYLRDINRGVTGDLIDKVNGGTERKRKVKRLGVREDKGASTSKRCPLEPY